MSSESHHILVVDDDSGNLALLLRVLNRKGYAAEGVQSGEAALDAARQCPPDLVLLDVLMPGMDGYETCRRLKQDSSLADIPVLFISGRVESLDRLEAFEAGGLDYITKPFDGREVTARVKAHLDIRDLQAELKQRNEQLNTYNDRLKELETHRDQLVSMVVHDMRSPITVIDSTLKLLKVELDTADQEIMEDIDIAQKNAAMLARMAEDLLHISRLESGTVELDLAPCSLSELVGQALEGKGVSYPEVTFEFRDKGADVSAVADAAIVKRILDNLLSNAASFSPSGEKIVVEVEERKGEVELSIADRGPGVDKEMRERIFEKFQRGARGHERKRSIGLGLAFCKLAVEAHGGTIGVENNNGSGSRFWFRLPTGQ